MTNDELQLYNQLKKEVKRANQRILSIERKFGKESWAVKRLRNKLDTERLQAWTKSSRIRLNKSMNLFQLKAIAKATENFLNSQTSTIRGIKKQIASIKKSFKDKLEISEEEAEEIYQAFSEDLIQWIMQYIEPSEFWAIIQESKEYRFTQDEFIDTIEQYIYYGNDETVVDKLKLIYERYV